MTVFVIAVMFLMFGLGYILGEEVGWDRCWNDLTKDDEWRKEGGDG